jgi:hypothetical protein
MADTLTKQPAESRLFDMDFSPRIATTEILSGIPAVSEKTVDPSTGVKTVSTDLSFGTASISGQIAQVRISGGLDGVLYEVTFVTGTSLGNTVEAEGLLMVVDTI